MVPLTRRSLVLPASPPSVKLARSWVTRVLGEIGRDDLVDSAQLGVTELVTNALIHSRPPLSVRVRGTVDHPRIEVVDSSPVPPQRLPTLDSPADLDDLDVTTFGRGLALVAMSSSRWGSDLGLDGRTKSVWFEPGTDATESPREGELFAFTVDPVELEEQGPERVDVHLLDLPVQLFSTWRRFFFELRRELRLLSISAPDDYPLAVRLTDVIEQSDRERRVADGIGRLDEAIAEGRERVDLHYRVPLTAPATMAEARDLLGEVFAAFSEEHLLAVRPADELVSLAWWYLSEFERQGTGEPPLPYDGPLTVAGD